MVVMSVGLRTAIAIAIALVHGERITYAVLAVIVGIAAVGGELMLTDSHATEEPAAEGLALL